MSISAKKAEAIASECRQVLERPLEGDYEESSAKQIAVGFKLMEAVADSVEKKLQIESLPQLLKLIDELPPAPALYFRLPPEELERID